jgi:hypothetical protein
LYNFVDPERQKRFRKPSHMKKFFKTYNGYNGRKLSQ